MLICSFGTPSPFAQWGFTILRHLLDNLYGAHHWVECSSVEELRAGWQERNGRAMLVTSVDPDLLLSNLLTTSGFPCVAFIDEPEIAIVTGIHSRGLPNSLRYAAQCISAMSNVLCCEAVKVFRRDRDHRSAEELVVEILSHINGGAPSRELTNTICQSAGCRHLTVDEAVGRVGATTDSVRATIQSLTDLDRLLLFKVADGYRPVLKDGGLDRIEWPRELFLTANSGWGSPEDIDLVGGARHLAWGPYLALPTGFWRAFVEFEIIENVSGNILEADVCISQQVVAVARCELPPTGVFRFSLNFEVKNSRFPIEVRMTLLRGAIEGRLGVISVRLEKLGREDVGEFPLSPMSHYPS
jgi:hypothetical protein